MGFRYRKSINLGGGAKLNLSKKGIGVSAGVKGIRVSHGADGKTRVTASIPGTGLSYQETLGNKKQKEKQQQPNIPEMFDTSTYTSTYQFSATVRNKVSWGERESMSVLLNQPSTVSFYDGLLEIKTKNPELGGDKNVYSPEELKIQKNVRDRGMWFWKYQEVELLLDLQDRDIQYTLIVPNEQEADKLIEWHKNTLLR